MHLFGSTAAPGPAPITVNHQQTLMCRLQGLHDTLGTPTTLQIGARPFDESTLIEIAYAYEQATMHRAAPQLFPECTDPVITTSPSSSSMGAGISTSGR